MKKGDARQERALPGINRRFLRPARVSGGIREYFINTVTWISHLDQSLELFIHSHMISLAHGLRYAYIGVGQRTNERETDKCPVDGKRFTSHLAWI